MKCGHPVSFPHDFWLKNRQRKNLCLGFVLIEPLDRIWAQIPFRLILLYMLQFQIERSQNLNGFVCIGSFNLISSVISLATAVSSAWIVIKTPLFLLSASFWTLSSPFPWSLLGLLLFIAKAFAVCSKNYCTLEEQLKFSPKSDCCCISKKAKLRIEQKNGCWYRC